MNSLIPLSYARTPSQELRKLLLQGFLSPLLSLSGRESHHCRLDIHFRAKDHVYVYCGRARILDVVLDNKGTVKVTADPK